MSGTYFYDLSSGGEEKLKWKIIFIEEDDLYKACQIFEEKLGRDPYLVTCDCCGEDYAIEKYKKIEDIMEYYQGYTHLVLNGKGEDINEPT